MVIKYKHYKTRVNYCGLFTLLIDDSEKTVVLSGPNRSEKARDQVDKAAVDKNREWAMGKAKRFEMLGYSVVSQQSASIA